MAEVLFYHLSGQPMEIALTGLIERSLERGWRVLVRCGSQGVLAMLDEHLWSYRDDAFLPHGTAASGHAVRQPVYLTLGAENPNGADVLMLVAGARVRPAELRDFARTCLIFEAADAAAVAAAREDWRAVLAAGLPARYWAQEAGRWVEKARAGG